MSTTPAAPPTPEATRAVAIDFLYLDVSTCARCHGTDANLDVALSFVEDVLRATDTEVQVRRTQVRSAEQARELQFEISPTIRVNGRDIALEQRQSPCGPDGCACGRDSSCRVWVHRGREHTAAPVGMIVDAILTELDAGTPRPEAAAMPYELPGDLARTLVGGGCCS